ncbi:isopropylmalate/homocitrate/citramalate synthase [Ruminiclostridium sufflavum DSM 19573]|uniref:Isopropylmalate/homocitrate/citramalate synthase n=1 Tax=Ruminiclostridium sufflavum DSM 19573 TaxID=1121337 RepID=A0A318XR90_9FIRM|nr:2-isopropylmalate synthase [Ruminiclostridium sufflavum]PYG88859.1 isopropylmalate/homocitrate/citramalate synthase [Ruminiclostridium sufflavum DSM 19573]
MIEFNKKSNTLEQTQYRYSLQDVSEPNLYREIYNYEEVPKCAFNHRRVPMNPADEIWITDTTFRDGQQSRAPYTVEQIVRLYDYLNKLGGPKGIIRQTEFFLYSDKDKEAVCKCMERGYKFPEVTSWIRASKSDFKLAKEMGMKETGFLVSCSDYHIFKKLKKTRKQAMDDYLSVIKEALEVGIKPRCHFEDITRADFYGFVVPFASELKRLMDESGVPIKIRACDTMGYGVTYPGAALPRSVPGIIYGLRHHAGFPGELLEWHGHNDFYKAVDNSSAAWLYGCSSVNGSLLGIGERTGNTPLEAMVFEYCSLRGTTDGMDTAVITEIADYYERELDYEIPPRTPFVGKHFNVTQAGIHADGMLKDEEIYNIFNTAKLLNRPIGVAITQTSGLAGIALWINNNFRLSGEDMIDKKDPRVARVKDWIDEEYQNGRITSISDKEMLKGIQKIEPGLIPAKK